MQRKSGNPIFNPSAIKDPDLRAYFQHLDDSLNRQNQDLKIQSIREKIFRKFFESENTQIFLDSIINDIRLAGSSIRLWVNEERIFGGLSQFSTQCGDFSGEYAYLDDQLTQQLENKTQLIIPDTAKIHSIKFVPDKKYPKTIAAFHFLQDPKINGYFRLTYEAVKEFTDFELEMITQISTALKYTCKYSRERLENFEQSDVFSRGLNIAEFPILVISPKGDLLYTNRAGDTWTAEDSDSIRNHPKLKEWLAEASDEIQLDIPVQNHIFRVKGQKIKGEMDQTLAFLILTDESDSFRKRAYLELAIDTVCHDFKSALVNLQGFSKLLGMVGEMSPKQNEYLSLIGKGVEDIATIVNDLFEISRMEAEGGLRLSLNQPEEILQRAVDLIQAEARQKRLEISIHSHTTASVMMDRVFILAALHILLNNAVRNSHISGSISLNEQLVAEGWEVSIKDEGKGISQVDIEMLEKSHFQADDWPGLALVDRIARFHKGRVKIESELGKGSKFSIWIPGVS